MHEKIYIVYLTSEKNMSTSQYRISFLTEEDAHKFGRSYVRNQRNLFAREYNYKVVTYEIVSSENINTPS